MYNCTFQFIQHTPLSPSSSITFLSGCWCVHVWMRVHVFLSINSYIACPLPQRGAFILNPWQMHLPTCGSTCQTPVSCSPLLLVKSCNHVCVCVYLSQVGGPLSPVHLASVSGGAVWYMRCRTTHMHTFMRPCTQNLLWLGWSPGVCWSHGEQGEPAVRRGGKMEEGFAAAFGSESSLHSALWLTASFVSAEPPDQYDLQMIYLKRNLYLLFRNDVCL